MPNGEVGLSCCEEGVPPWWGGDDKREVEEGVSLSRGQGRGEKGGASALKRL